MNDDKNEEQLKAKIKISTIKTELEAQTSGQIVKIKPDTMEPGQQEPNISLRKRRNLSKNRVQATRQREKTPEPGRTPVPHEDTTTSDDEEVRPSRTSREIEADNTYEEMRRLVLEKATVKDPVYDLNTEEVLEARAVEANERRRRSISPFALPEKDDTCQLERKGSFIDPTNKLLSTTYAITPKDEDTRRRGSITIDPMLLLERKGSISISTPNTASPKNKEFPYPLPSTPKKLEEIVYPDEKPETLDKKRDEKTKSDTQMITSSEFNSENKKEKQNTVSPKTHEIPTIPGELVTKVIQIQRTPSKKIAEENKPNVEVRERIVRTPSRKISTDSKPIIIKQQQTKISKDETKPPPVKPARSKSASRFGGKTSDSEMSEDQTNQHNANLVGSRRKGKVIAIPRRFTKNRSPKANRSHSVNRAEDLKDKTGLEMSQTSREILELMQKARARSLSIPKDDPQLPLEYEKHNKNLTTPNKTPTSLRNTRGISCPKTIQIISDKEILSGLTTNQRLEVQTEKQSRHSSGYIDASQSEYTSSCYSTSPSENEFEFDLNERTAELTRKLNILSKEVSKRDAINNNILTAPNFDNCDNLIITQKSVLRKRIVNDTAKKLNKSDDEVVSPVIEIKKDKEKATEKRPRSRLKLLANWQQHKYERKHDYEAIRLLINRCICDILLLIALCGLGGMMFKTFEGSFENAYKCGSRNLKRDFIESLWRGTHYLREDDWKSMARKKLYEFENQLHTAHEAGVTSYSGQRSWNFMNSFVYCLTLVTTIGYGHIAPKTTYGRVATIVYAIIGIPLFLIVLADFGKLFTRIIKFFWAFIRRFYYTRSCKKVRRTVPVQEVMKGLNIVYDVVRRPSQIFSEEDMAIGRNDDQPPPIQRRPSDDVPPPLPPKPGSIKEVENETEPDTPAPSVFEIDDEFNLPISVAIFILVVYIFIGAVGYNIWEEWTFFESFYFVFISMSTIGLGDLVPVHPMFMMASILYLVFGLALTSMCINVVQVKLSNTFRQASAKLGATIGLKVAEEDGSLVPITPPPVEIVPVHKSKNESEEIKNVETKENNENNR